MQPSFFPPVWAQLTALHLSARRIHAGRAEALVARGSSHRHPVGLPLLLGVHVGGEGHRAGVPCQPASSRYSTATDYRCSTRQACFPTLLANTCSSPGLAIGGITTAFCPTVLVSPRSLDSSLCACVQQCAAQQCAAGCGSPCPLCAAGAACCRAPATRCCSCCRTCGPTQTWPQC
jgi:hypothetical protein